MRLLIIVLVAVGVGLTAWLSLRGNDPIPSGANDGRPPPRSWLTDALGPLTSPFAHTVDLSAQTFDISPRDATLRIPPAKLPSAKGPRVARFKLEAGPHPVPILFKDVTLYLLPEAGAVQTPPCVSPKCISRRGTVTLALPDEGGDVTIKQTPGGKVALIP